MAVGIVVVSHSEALAQSAVDLAWIMVHDDRPPVAIAAGLAGGEFGTDATAIMEAIETVRGEEGVVVFVDMGSAVLSTETAIDLLDAGDSVRIAAAPFVEGLVAGLVRAATGGSLADVVEAAEGAMGAKLEALGLEAQPTPRDVDPGAPCSDVQLVNEVGLHARPAARLAALASKFDAEVKISLDEKEPVNAKSTMRLMALGAAKGDWLHVEADGPQAAEALAAVADFIRSGMGD